MVGLVVWVLGYCAGDRYCIIMFSELMVFEKLVLAWEIVVKMFWMEGLFKWRGKVCLYVLIVML